jgi:hypothetical protein
MHHLHLIPNFGPIRLQIWLPGSHLGKPTKTWPDLNLFGFCSYNAPKMACRCLVGTYIWGPSQFWNNHEVHPGLYLGVLRHSVKLRTYPRLHGRDSVSRTNTIDAIELLYSYLTGMNGVAYTMHNVLCRSMTTEARFTASSRSSGPHLCWSALYGGIWSLAMTETTEYSAW